MTSHSPFAADTSKLAYAQAFSRTSAPHAATRSGEPAARGQRSSHTPLRALSSRLHRTRRSAH
jgi:hypothetical protein